MASTSTSAGSVLELEKCNDSIYVFHKSTTPNAEIIFFHDVHWGEHKEPHLETWMSSSTPSVCWPREWLSEKFSHARILSARYDGAIWKTNTGGRMDLYRIAENLWQDILELYDGNCPVFLVGHGLGGLVIKAVIHSMYVKLGDISASDVLTKDRLSSFLKNLEGVFFYNAPFLGTRLADYVGCFPDGSPLLKIIKTLNEESSRLNEWFRGWRGRRCKTRVISASLPTKVTLGLGDWHFQVVEEPSARFDTDGFYTCQSDHFGACKPSNQKDNRFSMLSRFLAQDGVTREIGPPQITDYSGTTPCKELTSILGQVAKYKQATGLHLNRYYLEKIRTMPEQEHLLLVGLKEAGLTQSRVCGSVELWLRS